MRNSYPQSINSLFINTTKYKCSSLFYIHKRTAWILKLNGIVNILLPASLRPWCRVGNFRNGIIILECANASWMMRLCYEKTQLLSALRVKTLASLSSIDIKINPILAIKSKSNSYVKKYMIHNSSENLLVFSLQSAKSVRYVASRSEGRLQKLLEQLASLIENNCKSDLLSKIE